MVRKKRKTADAKLAATVDKLTKIMATINESADQALESLANDPATNDNPANQNTVERIMRAGKKGLVILETLRSSREE